MKTYTTRRFGPLRYATSGDGWHYFSHGMRWLRHGGWFLLSLRHPIQTLRWWWRFVVVCR